MNKFSRIIAFVTATLLAPIALADNNFCQMPSNMPTEKEQDALFLEAMFEADYIFKGRLFTYYNEKCDDEICAYDGLVFKTLIDVENYTSSYVETSWQEDCDRLWLFPTDWRLDKEQMFFEINKEYLILAKETDQGIVVFGARKGLKIKELSMLYTLNRLGGQQQKKQ